MKRLLLLMLVVSTAAFGQRRSDDAPIPYDEQSDEDDDRRRDLPKRSEGSRERLEETEVERQDREISLAADDDPNIGIGIEIIGAALLLDSSRAQGVEPLGLGGIRITWEWARTFLHDEFWRELFFVDVAWFGASARGPGGFGGTRDLYASQNYHNFTIAEGFALPLGKTPLAFFVMAGFGFAYQTSQLYVQDRDPVAIAGTKLLAQYGLGLRARIQLVSQERFQEKGYEGIPCISLRLEVQRFRRGYMDDTMIGGSAGITF